MEYHTIEPYYNKDSKILILGSFPSIKSREVGFFYSHPQNRFWKVLAQVFKEETPISIEDKKDFLKRNKVALFDVCASCSIKASSDASIKDVVPNDLTPILNNAKIERIYVDGKTAYNLYNKYLKDKVGMEAICLSSTSPANAKMSLEDLVEVYKIMLK